MAKTTKKTTKKATKKTTKKAAPPKAKAAPKPKKRAKALLQSTPPTKAPPPMALGASSAVLDRLWSVIMSRRNADPAVSHSARLLARGTAKIAQKFGEEAVECLIEATRGDHHALVGESADVLYHLIVMWVDAGLRPEDVWAELQRREGVSGIAEKSARARALPRQFGVRSSKIP